MADKKIIATVSLAGCFGCHMSLLDIDGRLLDLVNMVEFDRSPLTDYKTITRECDIGLVEGGCCNDENVRNLIEFRKKCRVLVSVGECAIMGGIPAIRNNIPLSECLEESYGSLSDVSGTGCRKITIPDDPEIPKILDRVYPCHDIVTIDHFIPGCPPNADILWDVLCALIKDTPIEFKYETFRFD